MLGGLDGGDVARQAVEEGAQFLVGRAEPPPVLAPELHVVLIALRLHPFEHVLVDCGKTRLDLLARQRIEIDHLHPARAPGEVAAIAVIADMGVEAFDAPQTQHRGLSRRDHEAGAVQHDATAAKRLVGGERPRLAQIGAERKLRPDHPRPPREFHAWRIGPQIGFLGDGFEHALLPATLAYRHRDPHGGLVGRLEPGVVGDGIDQRERLARFEMALDDAARKGLGNRIRGDEAEADQRIGRVFLNSCARVGLPPRPRNA